MTVEAKVAVNKLVKGASSKFFKKDSTVGFRDGRNASLVRKSMLSSIFV